MKQELSVSIEAHGPFIFGALHLAAGSPISRIKLTCLCMCPICVVSGTMYLSYLHLCHIYKHNQHFLALDLVLVVHPREIHGMHAH